MFTYNPEVKKNPLVALRPEEKPEDLFKVVVAGTRTFDQYLTLVSVCNRVINEMPWQTEIVSGGAKGADYLGEKYAESVGSYIKRFPADWNKHGRSAGPIRNREMALYSDLLILFWDGESRGSLNMFKEMLNLNKPTVVYNYITGELKSKNYVH